MNLTLTPDIERALSKAARTQGTDIESVILKTLRECFLSKPRNIRQATPDQPKNLADMLTGYTGRIDSGELAKDGTQLSENTGKKFADLLLQKQQQGKI